MIDWIEIDHSSPPDRNDRILLSDGEDIVIGGYFGGLWLTEGTPRTENWVPTHYAIMDVPTPKLKAQHAAIKAPTA